MLSLILLLLSGVLVGYLFRRIPQMQHVDTVLNIVILLLLFFLGVSVGTNEEVLNNFPVIGLDAFLLTFSGISGTLLCAWWIYRKYFKQKDKAE